MKRLVVSAAAFFLAGSATSFAQDSTSEATLRVNSRAVLVDVIVTDRNGKPVQGLTKENFSLTEQG